MKRMTAKEKHTESQKRALIIKKAKEYTSENIDYLDKNSNVTNDQCISIIAKLHIKKQLIRDIFVASVYKSINKLA